MNKNRFTLWVFLFIVLVSGLFIPSHFYNRGYIKGRDTALKSMPALPEKVLTEWVYAKSSRISMDTAKAITKEAMKTQKPLLILAVISVESEFIPSATSSAQATGLMQVRWEPHKKVLIEAGIAKEKRDLYNIETSIMAGSFILNGYLNQTGGELPRALAKYLGGKDGYYNKRILENLGNLYVLTKGY